MVIRNKQKELIILYKRFRRNLLIILTVFVLLIIAFLSFIDMKRMSAQLTDDYIERIHLAEMNVKTALKQWNVDYMMLDEQIAEKMRTNSETLLKKYEENPRFEEWDFNELKSQFDMDVYIINKENKVIYSSFKQDLGLDFNSCCKPFATLLTERREKGVFVDDVIDLQKDVGELKKYSYMPTNDGEYILELSYDVERNLAFQQFSFVPVMNNLKTNYPFIKSISIFNEDYYELNESKMRSLLSNKQEIYPFEWVDQSSTIKENNYIFLNKPNNTLDESTIKVVEIAYDNSKVQKSLKESKSIFYIQVVGTFFLAVLIIIFIYKIVEKPMYLAFHDRLTGLKNRAAFENEIQRLLESNNSSFGLLLLDFDNFKRVNDTLGHDSGDLLLKFVANYIKTMLPEKSYFARFGGDEFIILLKDIKHRQEMEQLANRLIKSFKEIHNEHPCFELYKKGFQVVSQCDVTLSIGGSLYPQDGKDGDTLYKKADIALYYSKEHGKCRYTYYTDGMGC